MLRNWIAFKKLDKLFKKKFQCPYQFLNDISQEIILNDINRYKKKTQNEKDIIIFNCKINIIKGDKVNINFEELFEELDKNTNCKIDPNRLRPIIGHLNQILDLQLKEADKGSANLYLMGNKHLSNGENLTSASESNSQTLKIQIGTKGILMLKNKNFILQPIWTKI